MIGEASQREQLEDVFVTIFGNALKSSNLMGGRPLYISVSGGVPPPPGSPDISEKRLLSDRDST
jgi:hypothetical protein